MVGVAKPLALVNTGVDVNGCKVFMGHMNPSQAKVAAEAFKRMMGKTIARSKQSTMSDYYQAHFQVCQRLKDGESIEEIMS